MNLPLWSVYRRTPDGCELVDSGGVAALTEQQAIEVARGLPGAPRWPVVCLAHRTTRHALALVAEPKAELERRSRRRIAA